VFGLCVSSLLRFLKWGWGNSDPPLAFTMEKRSLTLVARFALPAKAGLESMTRILVGSHNVRANYEMRVF
jgi:hypothetical protein